MAMNDVHQTFLPAAGRDLFLPLYDPVVRLLGIDAQRRSLIQQAGIRPGDRILDVGCGTGTLAMMIKQSHPEALVTGLDPDPRALARSRRKVRRAAVAIRFDQGFSEQLPYSDASFDRVFSSFMFHHLSPEGRTLMLCEVRRVLSPSGSLHLVDVIEPKAHAGSRGVQLHSSQQMKDNTADRILALMRHAGFAHTRMIRDSALFFGRLRTGYFQAAMIALE